MSTKAQVPTVETMQTGIKVGIKSLTPSTSCAPPPADPQAPANRLPLGAAVVLATGLDAFVWLRFGAQPGIYLILGLALGWALYHSRFGFSAAWQRLVTVGNGEGMRAQALMLATVASVVALLSVTGATLFGSTPTPTDNPIGPALVLGAVLFGTGMQLAGSCATGTLFAVGTAQLTILPSLAAFIAGELFYTWAYPVLGRIPAGTGVLLSDLVGWPGSWGITIGLLGAVYVATLVIQRRHLPPPVELPPSAQGLSRLLRGSWRVYTGAVVLGLLAGLVFLVSGKTWGAANAFALWGAKILQSFGLHPEAWEYWRVSDQAADLHHPALADRTSLTNFGIMIGAAAAAAAAGAWKLSSRVPARTLLAALLGGFMMGIGTRLTNGCNIGAFIGGISSGSVSGWIWGACAIAGTALGVRLRPFFGLNTPKPMDGIC